MDPSEIPPAPDGGCTAWLQVLLMHLVFFNTWGVTNSFGVFQQYYTETLNEPRSTISWIGSVQTFFLFSVGVFAGRATDAGHFRIVFSLGVFLQLLGLFLTSLCKTYWQIFLAQAVCIGLGNGCTFCPALAVVSSYFSKHRGFAVGLASAGAATGGLVYATIVNQLIYHDAVGFAWTVRTMGFVMLTTSLPCVFLFAPRLPPRKTGPLIDKSAFSDIPFLFFTASMAFSFWGLYFAFFYLGIFARDRIGLQSPINLVMVLNGIGIPGRILPNLVGDRWTGRLNILILFNFVASLLVYCWAFIHSGAALYVFAVIYGFLAAALQALYPAIATTMTPSPDRTGTRTGMIFWVVSFASLTGPAIDGALIQREDGGYLYAQIFAASCVLVGGITAAAARIVQTGWVLKVKV